MNTTDEMQFFYDAQSRVSMLKYDDALYSYVHNQQGDIVGIHDSTGNMACEYYYDVWGECYNSKGNTITKLNPFRYRGYLLDEEISCYYLRKRYYVISTHRFASADMNISFIDSEPMNVFAYCGNLPTFRTDRSGEYWIQGAYAESWNFYHIIARNAIAVANGLDDHERCIPGILLRPDLIVNNQIYEVKSIKKQGTGEGENQVERYVAASGGCYQIGSESLNLPIIPLFSIGSTNVAMTLNQEGCVIYYKLSVSRSTKNKKTSNAKSKAVEPISISDKITATDSLGSEADLTGAMAVLFVVAMVAGGGTAGFDAFKYSCIE